MKEIRFFKVFIGLLTIPYLLVTMWGCATPQAKLSNVPQVTEGKSKGRIYIGPFIDKRQYDRNFSTEHLGTVRGGFGNVLMRVTDWRGADEFVREHIINAARFSSFVADRTPDSFVFKDDGKLEITDKEALKDMRPILRGSLTDLPLNQVQADMQKMISILPSTIPPLERLFGIIRCQKRNLMVWGAESLKMLNY